MLLRIKHLMLMALGVICISALSACGSKNPGAAGAAAGPASAVEVGVVTLEATDASLVAELPGRTTAFRKAEVRPQVTGIIQKRLYEEGSEVKAGQPLYQIDPATYRAALATARAELARAEANLAAAKSREARYKDLVAARAISQQEYDDALAALGQANAAIAAGKAAVETARINLEYTEVRAPISGVISKSSVTEGALVSANQAQVLTTIQQLDPIYVDVSQSAENLLRLRRQMQVGTINRDEAAKVALKLEDGTRYEHEGELQFSEVGVSESTGTVVLRAIFPNPDKLLLPGMFVRSTVQEGVRREAILAPQQGIAFDRSGSATALVVGDNNTVEPRQLKVGRSLGHNWVVEEGLQAGDRLIVEGLQKVRPGTPVTVVPARLAETGN